MNTENIYQKMKLIDLKNLAESKNIICKDNKESIIESLLLFDKNKYIFPTTYEKTKEGFVVGISMNNTVDLIQIGKLIEKGEAKSLNIYCNDRIHYLSTVKLV